MTDQQLDAVSGALYDVLQAATIYDSNFDRANVVDGLFAIARSVDRLADAISGKLVTES